MKIRSYKGTSRETICETILREMGPEAIIVSSRESTELKGFMPKRYYELLAVADDASSDAHLLERATGSEEVRELAKRQEERWKAFDRRFDRLQLELRDAGPLAGGGGGADPVPGFAREWDPRFLRLARAQIPELFKAGSTVGAVQRLGELLKVCELFPVRRERRPHVVVLVGPTGSGKTTTVAKLAAAWCLEQHLKVGIITTDTFRIAAVDQAREYATLLGIEMRIAFSATEARRAVESFADKDVVLVDTPGRNHHDRVGMRNLLGMLDSLGPVSVLMLVPATMDRRHVPELLGSFKKLHPDYLVVTKTDESQDLDLVTTLVSEVPWPLAFLTDGQRVPQDLKAASVSEIAARLLVAPGVRGDESEGGQPPDRLVVPGPASETQNPPVPRRSPLVGTSTFERAA